MLKRNRILMVLAGLSVIALVITPGRGRDDKTTEPSPVPAENPSPAEAKSRADSAAGTDG